MSTKTVQDDVSRFGLRRVHLINVAGRIDHPPIPDGWRVVNTLEYLEEDTGVDHLWLFMKPEGSEDGNG